MWLAIAIATQLVANQLNRLGIATKIDVTLIAIRQSESTLRLWYPEKAVSPPNGKPQTYLSSGSSELIPQGVKWLLISQYSPVCPVLHHRRRDAVTAALWEPFGLIPGDVLRDFAVWQLVTYMFLHDPIGFGAHPVQHARLGCSERPGADLGPREFLKYYFLCGIGAGVCVVVANLFFSPTTGTRARSAHPARSSVCCSRSAICSPTARCCCSFLCRSRRKYFVMIFGAIAFLSSFGGSGSGVSHIAHLGGMVIGYFYLRTKKRVPRRPAVSLEPSARRFAADAYKEWKTSAQGGSSRSTCETKRDRDRDRFVH